MGKNFLSLIKTCRSVRAYKSESVPSKALDAVLEAGTYPAQEAGQPAERKQNYIVRSICGEEGKYADQEQNGGCARWKTHLANVDTTADIHVSAIFL